MGLGQSLKYLKFQQTIEQFNYLFINLFAIFLDTNHIMYNQVFGECRSYINMQNYNLQYMGSHYYTYPAMYDVIRLISIPNGGVFNRVYIHELAPRINTFLIFMWEKLLSVTTNDNGSGALSYFDLIKVIYTNKEKILKYKVNDILRSDIPKDDYFCICTILNYVQYIITESGKEHIQKILSLTPMFDQMSPHFSAQIRLINTILDRPLNLEEMNTELDGPDEE